MKLRMHLKYPESKGKELQYFESNKIKVRESYLKDLDSLNSQHFKQKQWMFLGKIDDEKFVDFLESEIDQEITELERKYYGSIKQENDDLGIVDVRL